MKQFILLLDAQFHSLHVNTLMKKNHKGYVTPVNLDEANCCFTTLHVLKVAGSDRCVHNSPFSWKTFWHVTVVKVIIANNKKRIIAFIRFFRVRVWMLYMLDHCQCLLRQLKRAELPLRLLVTSSYYDKSQKVLWKYPISVQYVKLYILVNNKNCFSSMIDN